MTLFVCWAVPRQHCAWFSRNARIATVTTFSSGWGEVTHLGCRESLSDHVLMEAFCPAHSPARSPPPSSPSVSPSPPPSFHFYLTSSNYFRVIPASRRLKRHWETKPKAPPIDRSLTNESQGWDLKQPIKLQLPQRRVATEPVEGACWVRVEAAFTRIQTSWIIFERLNEQKEL